MTYVGYSEPYPFTRGDTFMRRRGRPGQHRGTDTAPGGLPALSCADGRIAARTWTAALGHIVVIAFDDGKYMGIAHLAAKSTLPTGSRVYRLGSVGAMIGNTGTASSGRHMHYTIGDDPLGIIAGHVQDPIAYIMEHPPRPLQTAILPVPHPALTETQEEIMITTRSNWDGANGRIDTFGQEFVYHSKSGTRSEFVAKVDSAEDVLIPLNNTEELDAILDARGIDYNDYINLKPGETWSLSREIAKKIGLPVPN